MDRLVDHLFVFEGEGKVTDFWGTYSERKHHQDDQEKKEKSDSKSLSAQPSLSSGEESTSASSETKKLTPEQSRELELLIKELQQLEEEKSQINRIFENKDLPYDEIALLSEHLGSLIKQIEQKEARRFELSS